MKRLVPFAISIVAGLACLGATCVGDLPDEPLPCRLWRGWEGHDGPVWAQDESGPVIVFQWDTPDYNPYDVDYDVDCIRAFTGTLYTIRDDGTDLVRFSPSGGDHSWIEPGTAYDTSPAVSPDRTRVAYATLRHSESDCNFSYAIVTSRTNGGDRWRLTQPCEDQAEPSWSPDGTRIAFLVSFYPDIDERGYRRCGVLHTMAADGSGPRRLAPGVSAIWEPPAWSPDGKWLAFRGNPETTGCSREPGLYLVAADGSDVRRVAEAVSEWYRDPPAWSPDGGRIAFHGNRFEGEVFFTEIYVLDLREGVEQATAETITRGDNTGTTGPVLWSRDGTEVLVRGRTATSEWGLMAVAADGVDRTRWVARLSWNRIEGMAWSPDGERIAVRLRPFSYAKWEYPGADIVLFTVGLDGSDPRVLVREGPDGELLTATWEDAR